jgi:SAM-dependent methyltransferase
MSTQSQIDSANAEFWNTLCGSQAAHALGMTGNDRASLARFDEWFFSFYPYLSKYIDYGSLAGKKVLEIGLGYGSVGQKLAESGAIYTGLDIARGPVEGMLHRLRQSNLPGDAKVGSILDAPFADASFDYLVSIGCFHHTGNIERAVSEAARVLKPGGRAVLMVYNALSYDRWLKFPLETATYSIKSIIGHTRPMALDKDGRARFDVDLSGKEAPETVLLSRSVLRRILKRNFRTVVIRSENCHDHVRFRRDKYMPIIGPIGGTDLYATMRK